MFLVDFNCEYELILVVVWWVVKGEWQGGGGEGVFGGSCYFVLVVNNGEGEDCIVVGDWVKMLDGVRFIFLGFMWSCV